MRGQPDKERGVPNDRYNYFTTWEDKKMMNFFNNNKTRKVVFAVIAIVMVVAMIAPLAAGMF